MTASHEHRMMKIFGEDFRQECENCERRTSRLHLVPGQDLMVCDECMEDAMRQVADDVAQVEANVNRCPEHYRLSSENYNTIGEWYDTLKAHKGGCPFCSEPKGMPVFTGLAQIEQFAETRESMVRGPFGCLMADYVNGETVLWRVEHEAGLGHPYATGRHFVITRKPVSSVVWGDIQREVA